MYLKSELALRLLREKAAVEVYANGRFLGLKLGNFGVIPQGPLPPAELPGLRFLDPNPDRKYAHLRWQY